MWTFDSFVFKHVERKHKKVNAAITLRKKAKIVFNLDKNVFIFGALCKLN